MIGRSDFGSRPWLFPALLSYAPSLQLRRGTQQDTEMRERLIHARIREGRR